MMAMVHSFAFDFLDFFSLYYFLIEKACLFELILLIKINKVSQTADLTHH